MFTFFVILAVFIIFDLVALRWGVDSTDTIDSAEWERRTLWLDMGHRA